MQNKQSLLLRNQIPKSWQKVKLGEVALLNPSISMGTGQYPYIPMEDLDWNKKYVTGKDFKKFKSGARFEEGDVLFARITPCLENGKIGRAKNISGGKGFGSTEYFVIRGRKEVTDTDYLYYLCRTYRLRQTAINSMVGASGRQRANIDSLENYEVDLPDFPQQQKIASILSVFDDKIEVNNKIAKTLEEMAQVLFKEWFVSKKTEKWEVKKLSQILTLKHGFAFKSEQFTTNKTKNIVVRMGNFQEAGGLQFSDNTFYLDKSDGYEKYILKPGDMVMIFSDITREGRLIGNVGLIPNDENTYVLNQRVAKIEYDNIYKYFLLILFNSRAFHQHCLTRADSATVLNLKNEHIYEYQMAIPDQTTLHKFNKIIEPVITKIETIKLENQKLAALRDLLLPKLMKGEIKV